MLLVRRRFDLSLQETGDLFFICGIGDAAWLPGILIHIAGNDFHILLECTLCVPGKGEPQKGSSILMIHGGAIQKGSQ